MWILVQKKKNGGMQFHIVQRHSSASTAVLKKKINKIKNKRKMKVGGGGDVCCFGFVFFSLSAVMWPSPPQPSTQNRACNWVWVCLLSPLFDGKGWIGEGIKRMLCPPHLHAAAPPRVPSQRWIVSMTGGICCLLCKRFWSGSAGRMKAWFYWSDEAHLERQRGFKSCWNKACRQ